MRRRDLIGASLAALATGRAVAQPAAGGGGGGQRSPAFGPATTTAALGPGDMPGPSLDLNFINGSPIDSRISFTRASSATYFDSTGTMQTAASNVPRIDWGASPGATPLGLLIEEARTNLALNSATLGTQNVTVTAVAYTLSFYGTGTVTKSGVATGALAGSGATTRVTQTFTPTAGTLTLTVSGTVTNAQIEAGAFATSYIPTTSAAATRAADVATMPVGAWFDPFAGTVIADASLLAAAPAGINAGIVRLDDGTDSNRIWIWNQANSATIFAQVTASGSAGTAYPIFTQTPGTTFRSAIAWAPTFSQAAAGGLPPPAAAASGLPVGISQLVIGRGYVAAGTWILNGHIGRIRYWPRALGVGELQGVTR